MLQRVLALLAASLEVVLVLPSIHRLVGVRIQIDVVGLHLVVLLARVGCTRVDLG